MTQKEYIKRLEEQIEAQKKITYPKIQQITEKYNKCCSRYASARCSEQVMGVILRKNPHWLNLKQSKMMRKIADYIKHILYD